MDLGSLQLHVKIFMRSEFNALSMNSSPSISCLEKHFSIFVISFRTLHFQKSLSFYRGVVENRESLGGCGPDDRAETFRVARRSKFYLKHLKRRKNI